MIEAYPLYWPLGQQRTANPVVSRFEDHSLTKVTLRLVAEIGRMQGENPIISTNIPINKSGYPRSDYSKRSIRDAGVAVYFMRNGHQVVLACDKWDTVEDNIHAIGLTIEAMRSLDRWGVSELLDRVFSGFQALPAPGQSESQSCWDVLGIQITKDREIIKKAYWKKAKEIQGDAEQEPVVNAAYTQACKYAEQ